MRRCEFPEQRLGAREGRGPVPNVHVRFRAKSLILQREGSGGTVAGERGKVGAKSLILQRDGRGGVVPLYYVKGGRGPEPPPLSKATHQTIRSLS